MLYGCGNRFQHNNTVHNPLCAAAQCLACVQCALVVCARQLVHNSPARNECSCFVQTVRSNELAVQHVEHGAHPMSLPAAPGIHQNLQTQSARS
jgi:hypothetical protein